MYFVVAAGALFLAGQNPVSAAPAVAALSMEARGLNENTAKLATDALTQALRDSGVFGRVVSSADLEAALGFERQKQLLNCDASSCMAELAGAMGVQFLATGSVGLVGELRVLNIRLIQVRDARTSSVSRQARGDEALFLAIPGAVFELLKAAGFSPVMAPAIQPSQPAAAGGTAPAKEASQVRVKQETAPAAQPQETAQPVPPDEKVESGRFMPRWVGFMLAGGGALGLAAGPLVLVAGVVGAVVAGVAAYATIFSRQALSADVVAISLTTGVVALVLLGSVASVAALVFGIYLSL